MICVIVFIYVSLTVDGATPNKTGCNNCILDYTYILILQSSLVVLLYNYKTSAPEAANLVDGAFRTSIGAKAPN